MSALAIVLLVNPTCLFIQKALNEIIIIGSLNVSAYTFDDSTKAFANIRLSITEARPILQVGDDGLVVATLARRIRSKDIPKAHQLLKVKFVVYKHVWEHIDDRNMVINRGLNLEAFALQLSDMYEELGKLISSCYIKQHTHIFGNGFFFLLSTVSRQLIVANYNPVFAEERISRPQTDPNTNRPVPRVMRTVYSYNINCKRFEGSWGHPSLGYEILLNDGLAFDPLVVIDNTPGGDNHSDTASNHSSNMNDE